MQFLPLRDLVCNSFSSTLDHYSSLSLKVLGIVDLLVLFLIKKMQTFFMR